MNILKQNLVGKKVIGHFHGRPWTGQVIESVQDGVDFNHVIKLDDTLVLTHTQMGHPVRYKNHKPMVFQGLNYDTSLPQDGIMVINLVIE